MYVYVCIIANLDFEMHKYELQYMQVYSRICMYIYLMLHATTLPCPGSCSSLVYINTWAKIWPVDYRAKVS